MSRNYIEFISAYCDRWCERCGFTGQCSAYAVHIAVAMCEGNAAAGLELAVGRPACPGTGPAAAQTVDDPPPETPEAIADDTRETEARDARIDESPITTQIDIVTTLTCAWLESHRACIIAGANDVVRDALEVIGWDVYLIGAKLHRALNGRDEAQHGETYGDEHPIQNDWNGSAKVALISIERSRAGWQAVANGIDAEVSRTDAVRVIDELTQLQRLVEAAFPNARSFMRPGFDTARRRWWR